MAAHAVVSASEEREIPKANTKGIWKVFWILSAITTVEFIIAFAKGPMEMNQVVVITLFLSLTIVKAFYIVAEFMHLAHEAKVLIWSLGLPIIFLIWFIIAMMYEGSAILDALQGLIK